MRPQLNPAWHAPQTVRWLAALGALCLAGCYCGGDVSARDANAHKHDAVARDSHADVRGPRSPWAIDFGPMADIDPSACRPTDAWASSVDSLARPDGGGTTPTILWRRQLDTGSVVSQLAGTPKRLYVNISRRGLFALSPNDGAILWHKPVFYDKSLSDLLGLQAGYDALSFPHGLLGKQPPMVEARHLETGAQLWRLPIVGPFPPGRMEFIYGSLSYFKDGSRAIGSADVAITRISPEGTILWSKKVHGVPGNMYVDGKDRLIAGLGGELHKSRLAAFNRDGELLWERPIPNCSARPIPGDRDRVLVIAGPHDNMQLYAFEGSCGRLLWSVDLPKRSSVPAIDVDGAIIVISIGDGLQQMLIRISPDGKVLFRKKLDKSYDIVGWGPIGADGLLYLPVCARSPKDEYHPFLAGIDVKTGERRFFLQLGADAQCPVRAAPLLYPDGKLYIGTKSHPTQVIAIQTSSGGLANSVWPTQAGGNRRLQASWPAHDRR